ncbi:MAG TPA: tetratricopeptide repeat protein [Polyangiaceae bacterium]|nr:tetratricopeptide repeat protein [Polyangiaceae bacterium]
MSRRPRWPRADSAHRFRQALVFTIWLASLLPACAAPESSRRPARPPELEPKVLLARAEVARRLGDWTRAEQYYVVALESGGPPRWITQRLLEVCVADQRFPVALEYAEQYLARHPRDPELALAAASLHLALGGLDRARLLLEDILRSRPNWPEPHFALASVLRASERESGAPASGLADQHDFEYLKLSPTGPFAETARARSAPHEQLPIQ